MDRDVIEVELLEIEGMLQDERPEGEDKMTNALDGPTEERVIWNERFQGEHFDFQGKISFARFDGCEFVKCTLLIDHETEQLAFTSCVFRDCNIDMLEPDEERGFYLKDDFL